MLIERSNIRISAILIILVILNNKYSFSKAKFIIPPSIRTQTYTLAKRTFIITLILLPLNIRINNFLEHKTSNKHAIQILFDVSLSMSVNDIYPSRFDASRDMLVKIINQLQGQGFPISIIVFSGIPINHIPFSTNTSSISTKRQSTKLSDFPPSIEFVGTAIGDSLLLALTNLMNNDFDQGSIILITDGDNNKGYDPREVIDIIKKTNFDFISIGIGKPENQIVGYDHFGNPVRTNYDPQILYEMAETLGGKTAIAENNSDIDKITPAIVDHIKSQTTKQKTAKYYPINKILLSIILIYTIITTSIRTHRLYLSKTQNTTI